MHESSYDQSGTELVLRKRMSDQLGFAVFTNLVVIALFLGVTVVPAILGWPGSVIRPFGELILVLAFDGVVAWVAIWIYCKNISMARAVLVVDESGIAELHPRIWLARGSQVRCTWSCISSLTVSGTWSKGDELSLVECADGTKIAVTSYEGAPVLWRMILEHTPDVRVNYIPHPFRANAKP